MTRTLWLGAAFAALMLASQANAATTVVGPGPAGTCYQAALHERSDTRALRTCDEALDGYLNTADRAATHVNRGIIHNERGEYSLALVDFELAIGLRPDLAEAYTSRGVALLGQANYQAAVDQLTLALTFSPEDPAKAYYNRAIAYEELGDFHAAYADYRAAAQAAPTWEAPRVELTRFRVSPSG